MPVIVANYILNLSAGGKFVVLMSLNDSDAGVLVLSDFSRDFQHRDIVRRWENGRKSSLAAEGLRVAGGGWWKYQDDSILVLHGRSIDYGRFNPVWLKKNLVPGMVGREIRIDVR